MSQFKITSICLYEGDDREGEIRAYCNFVNEEKELKKGLVYFVKSDNRFWQTKDGKPIKTISLTELFVAMKTGTFLSVDFYATVRESLQFFTISK